jgi:hypothetical protein
VGGHGGPGLEGGGSVGRGGEYLGFGGGREGSHWSRSAPEEEVGVQSLEQIKSQNGKWGDSYRRGRLEQLSTRVYWSRVMYQK